MVHRDVMLETKREELKMLYPVAAELLRRALQPKAIDLKTVDLNVMWQFDSVPRARIREQLIAVVLRPGLDDVSRNNLIMLCGYSRLWGEACGEALTVLNQLALSVCYKDKPGVLNYYGLCAEMQVACGDIQAALRSLKKGAELVCEQLSASDLWSFVCRITFVCNRVGHRRDGLFFARAGLDLATVANSTLQRDRSEFSVGYCLSLSGASDAATGSLRTFLDHLLTGSKWIISENRALVPLCLANCLMEVGSTSEIQRLISMSKEFKGEFNPDFYGMQGYLTSAALYARQGDNRAARKRLNACSELLLKGEEVDLSTAARALQLHSRTDKFYKNRDFIELNEMARDLAPRASHWSQMMREIKKSVLGSPHLKGGCLRVMI